MNETSAFWFSLIALIVAVASFAVSAIHVWWTVWRTGTVKMTQPTVIYLGPESPGAPPQHTTAKVYLRTLLFSTSKRGRIIQNMFVSLSRNESSQYFSIWVYGHREQIVRGSGLFVGETGVEANHHFLPHDDARDFRFTSGTYRLDVYAVLLGSKQRELLFSQKLDISKELAKELEDPWCGLYFDWGSDSQRYIPHVDKKSPPVPPLQNFFTQ
jgi:hypothetical protein